MSGDCDEPSRSYEYDLLLQGGLVVTPHGLEEVSVAVRDGKIAALLSWQETVSARQTLTLTRLHVLPGCIDPHCHLWEKGFIAEPDFSTSTRSAIAGGVTTVIDHPLTHPEVLDASILQDKASLGERTSYCDFALHGGVSASNHSQLLGMWEAGATAFKIFMCRSGSAVEHLDDASLLSALRHIGSFAGIALFHAENQRLMDANEAELRAAGRKDPLTHAEWRPPEVETEAINRATYFCEIARAKGVFIHTSVPEGCAIADRARKNGVNVVVETCPHYLYFSTDDLPDMGPWIKFQPAVRDSERVARLWEAVRSKKVVMIGSDHGPVDRALKEPGLTDMWQAQGGVPSIETTVSMMLDAVGAGKLGIEQIASLTSTYAARWYGLYPRKGVIALGSDADFTVVDLNATWRVKAAELETPCGWTPYEGRMIRGRVRHTIIRGLVVAVDGKPTRDAHPGYGRFYRANHAHAGDPAFASGSAGRR
jgi:dihydroorotase/allantoinase